MHWQEHNTLPDIRCYLCRHTNRSAKVFNFNDIAVFDEAVKRVIRMNFKKWLVNMLTQFIHLSCFRHCMPLIAYASRCKYQREIRRYRLRLILRWESMEFSLFRRREENL